MKALGEVGKRKGDVNGRQRSNKAVVVGRRRIFAMLVGVGRLLK
jgi:hypothetical protein